jgi:A/G-specific adenine glycosylase
MSDELLLTLENVGNFRSSLIRWWEKDGRNYPWRETSNSFHILISEMMLQRTRADQVVPVYKSFIEKYPDPFVINESSENDIADSLFSLGLPQRVINIRKMAKQLVEDFDGEVPLTYKQLRELTGVGDYIASAVCCFNYHLPIIVVDTNTVRIVGRLFGITTDAESRRKKHIREKHEFLLDPSNTRSYNYALLDLGALICKPSEPDCTDCPILNYCIYGKNRVRFQNPAC